ncbi:hypothetical protein H696_00068 [Fonticula alba]|uniref:Disease resistance R13L4/SHOC-2-like LRR domain-containing protein n=1 Tax=Fonticula alba TaxID=691883 RepID=A0A058ZG87_FONAL|nr:hypothetical protein H696_00068 [Fonticula alba]KCV72472.1 hypothetical protein H696_00068 [Fonticula alba]|eukprot:XP_009492173.1 hypothetical protein H696_00068 [Fonticula alba]
MLLWLIVLTGVACLSCPLPPAPGLASHSHVVATLRHLFLSDNKITSLPAEIGNLTNLSLISLRDNRLTHLPPEIGKLSKLVEFNIQGNDIAFFPAEMAGLPLDGEESVFKAAGNPLIPEIVKALEKNGPKALLAYLASEEYKPVLEKALQDFESKGSKKKK